MQINSCEYVQYLRYPIYFTLYSIINRYLTMSQMKLIMAFACALAAISVRGKICFHQYSVMVIVKNHTPASGHQYLFDLFKCSTTNGRIKIIAAIDCRDTDWIYTCSRGWILGLKPGLTSPGPGVCLTREGRNGLHSAKS